MGINSTLAYGAVFVYPKGKLRTYLSTAASNIIGFLCPGRINGLSHLGYGLTSYKNIKQKIVKTQHEKIYLTKK
jgi:hypothetical protein